MKIAKLFKNGKSQAVRLPKEFRFEGDEVYIKRMGALIILLPINNPWRPLLDSLHQFSDDFMNTRKKPKQQIRENILL
jgi:antitoxin VapB